MRLVKLLLVPFAPKFARCLGRAIATIGRADGEQQLRIGKKLRYFVRLLVADHLADALFNHKLWIGMTTQMALDSWGYPKSMDRYLRVEKKYEDWHYTKYKLVFEDSNLIRWEKK